MNIVLLGAPGAGKGTQSAKLVEAFGFKHVSTGDLLRAAVKEGTELGVKAKGYMDAGELVPDEVVIGLVEELLKAEPTANYLLDGFPRTSAQAVALDGVMAELGVKLDMAISIDVENEVVVERISKRRLCKGCSYIGTAADGDTCPVCGAELYQRADDNADEQRAVCLLADQRQNDGNDGRQQRPCRLGKGFAVGALDCRSDDKHEHRRNDDDAHKRMRGVLLHGFVSFTKQKIAS